MELVFRWYTAFRCLGVNVDIVSAGQSLEGYRVVIVPSLPHVTDAAAEIFARFNGAVLPSHQEA